MAVHFLFPPFTETAMIAPNVPALEEVQSEFVALLPELTSRLSYRFHRRDPEAKEDAVAEAIGVAWQMFLSARTAGKTVTAGNLAFYAGRMVDAGRKMGGSRSSTDALGEGALARQRTPQHVSLEDVGEGCLAFCAQFGDRRGRWAVIDFVAPSMDWHQFEGRCSQRDQQIIKMKRAGWMQTEIASRLGISPPAVNQRLGVLRTRWNEMTAA
jgi:hypothetical protein